MTQNISSHIGQTGSLSRKGKIQKITFYVLAALLSVFFLVGFWDIIPGVVFGWLPDSVLILIHPDFELLFVPHRLHQMAMHTILWGLVLGVVLQLYRPERWVAPLLQPLTMFFAFHAVELAVGRYGGGFPFLDIPLILLVLLHPRVRELFRWPHLDWSMAGLTILAAIPWVVFALSQAEFARLNLPTDAHAQMEHWTRMAVFAVLMIVWGLLGATHLPGWRITAWTVSYGSIIYGLQSLVFPHQVSAAPTVWAIAAAGWGVVYLVATERRARAVSPERGEVTT